MTTDNGVEKIFKRMRRFKIKNSKLRTHHSELLFRSKGFTLIEMIILIVLAGILIPAIVVPFVTGVKGSGKPEMVTRAMYLGQQRMEELMKYNYGNPALNITGVGVFNPFSTGDPNYLGDNEIIYVLNNNLNGGGQAAPNTNYKRIHVRITDPEGTIYHVYSVVTNFP